MLSKMGMSLTCVRPQHQTHMSNICSSCYTFCICLKSLLCMAVVVAAWPGGLLLLGSRYCLPAGIFVAHFHVLHLPCGLQMNYGCHPRVCLVCLFCLHSVTRHLVRNPVLGGIRLRGMLADVGYSPFGWVGYCM